jgi:hypothetical protein
MAKMFGITALVVTVVLLGAATSICLFKEPTNQEAGIVWFIGTLFAAILGVVVITTNPKRNNVPKVRLKGYGKKGSRAIIMLVVILSTAIIVVVFTSLTTAFTSLKDQVIKINWTW